jgi:PAS domain S-box-containing protein
MYGPGLVFWAANFGATLGGMSRVPGALEPFFPSETWHLFFWLYYLAWFSLSVIILIRARRASASAMERRTLAVLLVSMVLPVAAGFLTDSLLPRLAPGHPDLGILWSVIWVLGVRYAADRYSFISPFRNVADSGRLFAAFLQRSRDGIIVADPERRIIVWNTAMEDITGVPSLEVLGRGFSDLGGILSLSEAEDGSAEPALRYVLDEAYKDANVDWSTDLIELPILDKKKSLHWLQASAFNFRLSGGQKAVAAIIRDVTRERGAALAAVEERRRFDRAEKMEAVGTLAAGLAHDFNNILTGIKGTVALLRLGDGKGGQPSGEELASGLELVDSSAARGKDLVRQLLALAGKSPVQKTRIRLEDALDHAVMLTRNTLDPEVKLELGPLPGEAWVLAGAAQVERVLINLILNAADAMTTMRSPGDTRGGVVRLGLHDGGGDWVLFVQDEGVGICEKDIPRVFDPFYTTKGGGNSHGLGLPAVLAIVEAHGGRVEVSSVEGRGSEFRVCLPKA